VIVAAVVAGLGTWLLVPASPLFVLFPFSASLVNDVARVTALVDVVANSPALSFARVCPTGLGTAVNHMVGRTVPGANGRGLLPLLDGSHGHHVPDPCHGCDGRVPFAEHGNEGIHEHLGGDEVLLRRAEDVCAR